MDVLVICFETGTIALLAAQRIAAALRDEERVSDGTSALPRSRVFGVGMAKAAVADAVENAYRNGLSDVATFFTSR